MKLDIGTAQRILVTVAGTVIVGLLAAAGAYGSKVSKTSPPWVSVTTESDDLKDINIKLLRGQIIAAWDRCVTAKRMPMKDDLVQQYVRQLAELQADYETLKGEKYPLECSP